MESIKKLEENWSKNQKKLAAERLALGEKNGLDITSNGNVTLSSRMIFCSFCSYGLTKPDFYIIFFSYRDQ